MTHDHIALEGFRLTNADILLWVQGATGVRVIGNVISGASGECVRLKYFARNNEVAGNRIEGCGGEGFRLEDDSKNGEGVYIGTAPEQRERNPTDDPDDSGGNWVHDNSVDVPAECVDVKEASQANLVEGISAPAAATPTAAGSRAGGWAPCSETTGRPTTRVRASGSEVTVTATAPGASSSGTR